MKNFRFLAIFVAFGFVAYQLYSLNTKVRDESALSSLIEVYSVTSDTTLSLRKNPTTDSEILYKLNGKDSGEPAKVLLLSKDNKDWWFIQYTDENENTIQGFVASEYLKLSQYVETYSLVWNETSKALLEKDSANCDKIQVPYGESELVALNLGSFQLKEMRFKGSDEPGKIFNGALLRRTKADGEFEVLSNPFYSEEEGLRAIPPKSIVVFDEAEITNLIDKEISIPELPQYIEDHSTIAERFKIEGHNDKFSEYNCCFEGKACERFVKLKPVGDALQEVLLMPYRSQSVFSKLQVNPLKDAITQKEGDESEVDEEQEVDPELAFIDEQDVEYTNYEEYFLGPESPESRGGKTLYRLNVRSGGGSVKNGPCGSYHFNPERYGGLVGGDRYLDKKILGCFLATLQTFKREYPDEIVQWGDFSRGDSIRFPPHKSHREGTDVDVRPIRNDKELLSCNMGRKANKSCYNSEITKAFVDIAKKFGGVPIYVNDPKIYKSSSKVKYMSGHYDHFHIRYSRSCSGVTLNTTYCPRKGFN